MVQEMCMCTKYSLAPQESENFAIVDSIKFVAQLCILGK